MTPRWGMVIDLDVCTGCGACVVACEAENNIPINEENAFFENRVIQWMRIDRYWERHEEEVDYSQEQAQHLPMLCQQCTNAPCEPVCPVYATYHTPDGLNAQIYNRCIGTRYCGNNCPWNVRFFNYHEHDWPDTLYNHLNEDVTVRSRGIMEKCTFCVQRIRRTVREAEYADREVQDGDIKPACVQTCPTNALIFGDLKDPESAVSKAAAKNRGYSVLGELGTVPAITYLKIVDLDAPDDNEEHGEAKQTQESDEPVIWMTVNG